MARKRNTARTFLAALSLLLLPTLATADQVEPNTLSLGLGGYSPVSYFNAGGPALGSPAHRATHHGVTYFFASDAELKAFNQHPEKYTPAYGGWCAYGMAVEGKFPADPTNYKIVDGKLNVFLKNDELDTRDLWNQGNEASLLSKAGTFWNTLNNQPSRAYLGAQNVDADGVALAGYSPVSYFTKGYAEQGSPDFAVEHDGLTYFLTNAEQADQFKADPAKYAPAYGGWCAFGMAVSDKFPVDPTLFKIEDGRLMLFLQNADVNALELWNQGKAKELTGKADAHWQKVQG